MKPEECRRTYAVSVICRRMGYCFRTFQFAGNIGFGVEARSAQRSKRVAVLMEMVALDPARLALAGRIVRRTAAARSFGPSAVSASKTYAARRAVLGAPH